MLTWPDTNLLPPTWQTLTRPAIKRATSTSARNCGVPLPRALPPIVAISAWHPLSQLRNASRGLMERPDGNNVSVERESLLLAETQMRFNLGIQLLKDQFHTISLAINSGGTSS